MPKITSIGGARVREAPSGDAHILGVAADGVAVEVVRTEGEWHALALTAGGAALEESGVSAEAAVGWVHQSLVQMEEPAPFKLTWPTEFGVITQHYGEHPDWTAYKNLKPPGHEGLDLRAPGGSKIFACADGVVSRVDQKHPAYGVSVRIDHGNGYETTYGHMQETPMVVGQYVAEGTVIGLADATGNVIAGAAHLHLNLKKDGVLIDPEPFLRPFGG